MAQPQCNACTRGGRIKILFVRLRLEGSPTAFGDPPHAFLGNVSYLCCILLERTGAIGLDVFLVPMD